MDRNDYYGGESTSLNLIQVPFSAKPKFLANPFVCFPFSIY